MLETQLRRILDGAKMVKFSEGRSEMVVWHGGTGFNVYSIYDGQVRERTMFTLSDEKGRPVSREEAVEHTEEWLRRRADAHA